jgi:hypothetical protein
MNKNNLLNTTLYFDEVLSLFDALPSFHTDELLLANRKIKLCTPSMELRRLFLPSLQHLVVNKTDNQSELTIWYAEEKDLHQKLKAPPWTGFNGQGYNASINQEDVQIFFQPWQKQLFLYSKSKKTGIYWVSDSQLVPWWECTFSFRSIFHLWTQDLPAQLIHSGAMAKNGKAVLITGKSGSGKSTSCLNLLRAGYNYLGDDYVWVELSDTIKVYTLYQTAKIETENLEQRFSDWKPFIINKQDYLQQKAIFDIKNLYPESITSSAVLKAILLPTVAYREYTSFETASQIKALMAMAPTTLHHLPHNRANSYNKMIKISSKLSSFDWFLGRDFNQFTSSFDVFINNEITNN